MGTIFFTSIFSLKYLDSLCVYTNIMCCRDYNKNYTLEFQQNHSVMMILSKPQPIQTYTYFVWMNSLFSGYSIITYHCKCLCIRHFYRKG